MLPNEHRRTALQHAKAFASLTPSAGDDLLRCLVERRLRESEALYREGDAGDSMAIVIEGSLVIRVRSPNGSETEIARTALGEILGELACIDPAPRSATVVALEPTTVYELSRDGLNALRRASPGVASLIIGGAIRSATSRLRRLEALLEQELQEPLEPPAPTAQKRRRSGFWNLIDRLRGEP